MNFNDKQPTQPENIDNLILDAGELTIEFPGRNFHLPLNIESLMNSRQIVVDLLIHLILEGKIIPTKESVEAFFKESLDNSRVINADIFAEFFWNVLAQERHNTGDRVLGQSENYPLGYYQGTIFSTYYKLNKLQPPVNQAEN